MIKFYTVLLVTSILLSCKNNSDLIEVQLPEPEIETSVKYGNPNDVKTNGGTFQLYKITYPYKALEPIIDGRTMEIHYSKHYLGYTNKLNKLVEESKEWEDKSIDDILEKVTDKNQDLKNNAGGYYNHSLYYEILTPKGAKKPKAELLEAINNDFVSFGIFKNKFISDANNHFGSGWIWLIVGKGGKLEIVTTNNQDNPIMADAKVKGRPILAIDLWEHAYYLQYQNNRKSYVEGIFEEINWDKVGKKYIASLTANQLKPEIKVSTPTKPKEENVIKPVVIEVKEKPTEVKKEEIKKVEE
ncbi:MAG: superoxide dismutase [Flavobacterium sp.]|nr:superoxide dismutase [Flavobacterium sp.]